MVSAHAISESENTVLLFQLVFKHDTCEVVLCKTKQYEIWFHAIADVIYSGSMKYFQ